VASALESIVFVIESAVSAKGKHCIFYTLYKYGREKFVEPKFFS